MKILSALHRRPHLRDARAYALFATIPLMLASASALWAAPALPNINTNNVITVTNAPYSAVGDGVTDNTLAISNAIANATLGGNTNGLYGGTVRIPSGVFLSGPLPFKRNVNLRLDSGAVLRMLPFMTYPGGTNATTSFITASSITNVSITGSGAIDGQGLPWWQYIETNTALARPNMINFSSCSRVLISGVTLSNSPSPFIVVKGTGGNITIQNVTVQAPASSDTPASHNTDAIDLAQTNALIDGCSISTGDDNLAVGSSASVSADIVMTNCFLGAGHGVSIGSYTSGGVSNLTVINCNFSGTDNGIRLKSQRDRGGVIQNLNYINLGMTNVDWPFLIYSYYEYGLGTLTSVDPVFAANVSGLGSANPVWRNITFSNITATTGASTRPPLMLWGMPEITVSNVVFRNINITSTSTRYLGLYNVDAIQFIDSQFNGSTAATTFQLYDASVTYTNSSASTNIVKLDGLTTNGVLNAVSLFNANATVSDTNAIDGAPLTVGGCTLSVSNHLRLTAASVTTFVLGTNSSTIFVRSNLFFGPTVNVTAGGGFTNGTYTLFTYGGTLNWQSPTLGTVPSGYVYSWNTNTLGQVKLVVQTAAPSMPTNLIATATNALVTLKWNSVSNATSYNLKRGTVSGTYPTVFSGIAATNYSDTTLTNGVTYYYVVSAVNAGGESGNSTQATATPQPSLNPTNVTFQISGNQLQLSWPVDHLGWKVQIQTNSLTSGLGTNWTTLPATAGTNQYTVPINPTNPSVFIRLVYP